MQGIQEIRHYQVIFLDTAVPFLLSAHHHAVAGTAEEFKVCGFEEWDLRGEVGRGKMERKAGKWGGKMSPGSFSPLLVPSLLPLSPLQIIPANPCRDLGLPVCPNHMSLQNCPLMTFHFPAFLLHAGILLSPTHPH